MEPKIVTNEDSVTIIIKGRSYTAKKGGENYFELLEAITFKDWDRIPGLASKGLAIEEWGRGLFKFTDNRVTYNGDEIPGGLGKRMLKMAKEGTSPMPLMRFWERLRRNPSYRAVQTLYSFLEHANIPILPDGTFLAYKSVRQDWKDHHTRTIENRPGKRIYMDRNKVSDDPNVSCSYGFHIGDLSYARSFKSGGKLLVVKQDPEHVVVVPYDSQSRKIRTCDYFVVGVHGADLPDTVMWPDEEEWGWGDAPEPEADIVMPGEKLKSEQEPEEQPPIFTEDAEIGQLPDSAIEVLSDPEPEPEPEKPYEVVQHAETPEEVEAKNQWSYIDNFNEAEMKGKVNLGDLRKYARHNLKIVGASKIPGGKDALIDRILEVRG
jgi:hypothetical protein